ncbi:hypothetical protein WICPIJ_001986 [Wickerhamomyces pijperi]|uniref:Uncharacterized protein n=1 Tax=Wickerhamomyces pijperi TaxID=599730 RepID=A0A9P8QCI0_WICPI|nr:hypothetical protein WICPIJ_001986 [Wickerhamomyces pijperi]
MSALSVIRENEPATNFEDHLEFESRPTVDKLDIRITHRDTPLVVTLTSISQAFNRQSYADVTINDLYQYIFNLMNTKVKVCGQDPPKPFTDIELKSPLQLMLVYQGKPLLNTSDCVVVKTIDLKSNNNFLLNFKNYDVYLERSAGTVGGDTRSSSAARVVEMIGLTKADTGHSNKTGGTCDNNAAHDQQLAAEQEYGCCSSCAIA